MINKRRLRTIRASEIGSYLYCRRAWWYQQRGYESQDQTALASGLERHHRHGRRVFLLGCQRLLAYLLLLLALALLTVYISMEYIV